MAGATISAMTLPARAGAGGSRFVRKFRRHRLGVTGLAIVAAYLVIAIFAPVIAPYDPNEIDLMNVAQGPSIEHPFGADQFGRDLLSRTIYGARTSLLLGFCVVGLATAAGLALGAFGGYFGGLADRAVVFYCNVMMTLPSLVIAMAVITVLGPGLASTIAAIAIASVPRLTRVTRGSVLQVRELDYIQGARALGAGHFDIVVRHVIPNSLSPVLVQGSLLMAEAVLVAAGLGFLGLGVQPPIAEWGQMLAEGRGYLRAAPFISIFPGFAIIVLVLGLNLLGDGLRDSLDVRMR